jgi:hypothetical protein
MNARTVTAAPKLYGRIAGVLYLVIIAAGIFAEIFVREKLIVYTDAGATAAHLLANESFFRLGIAADLSNHVFAVATTVIIYALLKPIHKELALLMAFFNLVQDAIGGINDLNQLRALQLLGGAEYLKVFSPEQLQALALSYLRAHGLGFGIALLFFSLSLLARGYLLYRSRYFPRILGVLVTVAGAAYLIHSSAVIVAPAVARALVPWILMPAFVGELTFALWLTVKGVNLSQWNENARQAE